MTKFTLIALLLISQSLYSMDGAPQDDCAVCNKSFDDNSCGDATRLVHLSCLPSPDNNSTLPAQTRLTRTREVVGRMLQRLRRTNGQEGTQPLIDKK